MCAGDDRNPAVPGGGVKLWDLAAEWERFGLAVNRESALSVAFSPDGKLLATGSPGAPAVRVWDVATGRLVMAVAGSASVRHLAFSPDGKTLATAHGQGGARGNGSVQLWDAVTWKEKAYLQGHDRLAVGVSFSPDGRLLATASFDGTAKLWPLPGGRSLASRGNGSQGGGP
jgi:WD40 repeat protein